LGAYEEDNMSRQLYLHFSDVHQRLCNCKTCSNCKKRERTRRYRLKEFLGITNKTKRVKTEDNLEGKLINYFKERGYDK
jgi:type II secretory ATPase GspE/PulE/Tfp pilus assembly ATPase PilB-like protein